MLLNKSAIWSAPAPISKHAAEQVSHLECSSSHLSLNMLRDKSAKYNDKPGVNHGYLSEQSTKYKKQAQKLPVVGKGRPEPQCDGALIFDEVKVINKLSWNLESVLD
jgi:hypothetical protein